MIKPKDIRSQKFTDADKIMLDTNVWYFLHGPQGNPADKRSQIYSRALADMIAAKCQIIVDVLVVSEFVNTYSRFEFNLVKQPGDDFKTFRNSAAFKPIATDIANEVRSILSISNRVESGFSKLNDVDLLNEFTGGNSDFNDLLIADICRTNNYTLVTHDGDFKVADLSVLTANGKLLAV